MGTVFKSLVSIGILYLFWPVNGSFFVHFCTKQSIFWGDPLTHTRPHVSEVIPCNKSQISSAEHFVASLAQAGSPQFAERKL